MTKLIRAPRTPRFGGVVVLMATLAGLLAACTTGTQGAGPTATVTHYSSAVPTADPTTSAPSTPATPRPTGAPVHIKTANSDGATYGVGMPIIAYFSKKITSATVLQDETTVTANGTPVVGGWFFEYSSAQKGYPIEAHWRPKTPYWPAHSNISVNIPMKGKSAGPGFVFDNSITLDFYIGASHVATVSNRTHTMTVVSDGKQWGKFDVSLGATKTPTLNGTKVIMEKGRDIPMRGPGYYEPHVKYTQRLTYGGEYLHAAPWNCVGAPGCEGPQNNIGRADSSNGCTNLRPADAKKLYDFLRIGDVVKFPDATGPRMQLGEGYGDWNVPWSLWQTGGLVPTK